jgi:acyl-CoA thioesterase
MDELQRAAACAALMFERDRASRDLGMSMHVPAAGSADVEMTVTESMVNGFGICHGGFVFTLADSAFAFACNAYDNLSVAAGASIEFFRPATLGDRLRAEAREVHRGRTSGTYDITVTNQDGQQVAAFRGRCAALGKPVLTG